MEQRGWGGPGSPWATPHTHTPRTPPRGCSSPCYPFTHLGALLLGPPQCSPSAGGAPKPSKKEPPRLFPSLNGMGGGARPSPRPRGGRLHPGGGGRVGTGEGPSPKAAVPSPWGGIFISGSDPTRPGAAVGAAHRLSDTGHRRLHPGRAPEPPERGRSGFPLPKLPPQRGGETENDPDLPPRSFSHPPPTSATREEPPRPQLPPPAPRGRGWATGGARPRCCLWGGGDTHAAAVMATGGPWLPGCPRSPPLCPNPEPRA